jgi:CRISPR-associated protein Csx10
MLKLIAEAVYPLSISKHPMVAGRPTETLDYITGTALRGAAAMEYLKTGGKFDSAEFRDLFLLNKVRWGNLYPTTDQLPSLPLPATALSCKRHQGFKNDDGNYMGNPAHGMKDCLINNIFNGTGQKRYCHEKCHFPIDDGTLCDFATDRYSGFYENKDNEKKTVKVNRRLDTHTAIDPDYESAKYEALFAMEVIGKNQKFVGFVESEHDELIKIIRSLLPSGKQVSVGNDRSRGFGLINIKGNVPGTLKTNLKFRDIEKRLELFRNTLEGLPNLDRLGFFSIYLYSDAIVMDPFLRYKTFIDNDDLDRSLASSKAFPNSVKLERGYSSSRMVHGWNTPGRLPKHVNLAILKGSVFVFSYCRSDEQKLTNCLNKLEERGIGERKNEGFGGIIVCNPFHQEVSNNERQ